MVIPLYFCKIRDALIGSVYKDSIDKSRPLELPVALFFLCVFGYCAYLAAMQPEWVLRGEMWAEMASNYFLNAKANSYVVRLFAADAGYVPLPQRLIALTGGILNLPAAAIPYFYTWSAILITGALVGSFCLRPFRVLVQSDWLRFLVAISILLVADFETRTFINFTYFVAFFVAVVSSLAFVQRSTQVPWWAWCIPVLMVSKPALLSVLPTMVMAALVSQSRFRRIVFVTLIVSALHISFMMYTQSPTSANIAKSFGFAEKLWAAIQYFLGFAGAFSVGKGFRLSPATAMVWGLIFLSLCSYVIYTRKSAANALLVVGLSLLFFNNCLNTFALTNTWNTDLVQLAGSMVQRHILVGTSGFLLVVAGLIESLSESPGIKAISRKFHFGPAIFSLWFILSGWLVFAHGANRAPGVPAIFNSQWQLMSGAIDTNEPVCVPVDPIGWIFERSCRLLNSEVSWGKTYVFKPLMTTGRWAKLSVELPDFAPNVSLRSMAILARPLSAHPSTLSATAVFHMKDGSSRYLRGARLFPVAGGLIHLTGDGVFPFGGAHEISLEFDGPVEVGYLEAGSSSKPAIIWMGH